MWDLQNIVDKIILTYQIYIMLLHLSVSSPSKLNTRTHVYMSEPEA